LDECFELNKRDRVSIGNVSVIVMALLTSCSIVLVSLFVIVVGTVVVIITVVGDINGSIL